MARRISTAEYFMLPEVNRHEELVYGVVREPPPPSYHHQECVVRLMILLASHVHEHNLGQVCVGPVAVVLDRDAGLVVSPDIIFTSNERLGMIDQRVWGAPDLIVEVASPRTAKRDRTTKLDWYRQYGVKEYWLVYPKEQRVEVIDLRNDSRESFAGKTPIASRVLPEFAVAAERCFE